MFDIAWSELALIGVVALIVIGPKDLPRVMRSLGKWSRKMRSMASEFQRSFDDMVRQAEIDEMRREVESAARPLTSLDAGPETAAHLEPPTEEHADPQPETHSEFHPESHSETSAAAPADAAPRPAAEPPLQEHPPAEPSPGPETGAGDKVQP